MSIRICTNVPSWFQAMLAAGVSLAVSHSASAQSPSLPRPLPQPPAFEELDITIPAPWNGEALGTGTHRPTPEQWAWSEANLKRLDRVPINAIGLDRLNAHRAAHGQPPVSFPFFDAVGPAGDRTDTQAVQTGGSTSATTSSLPTWIDNSTLKFFPPIRSQGSLNSCAQFSSVYYTLTHMTAMARDWDAKTGGDAFRFSPKWTYNMLNGGQNVGSWHADAYAIAQKHGVATWAEFPYDANYRGWSLNPTAWWNALRFRADQSGKVSGINGTGLDQLKQFLVNGYVLNFATYINSWVWGTTSNDPSTPADDAVAGKRCVTSVNGTAGGHSMTIVGYNDDLWIDLNANGLVDTGEKGALRVANSWGTSWNEAGFCWIAYSALQTRNPAYTAEGLAWYDEAMWVTARPVYTPRLVAQFSLTQGKRNQISMSLGSSSTTQSSPATLWSPYRILAGAGGAFAFDGNTTPLSGTFYLDLTDLTPMTSGAKRYYLGVNDSTSLDPTTLTVFTLVDPIHGTSLPATAVPINVDASQTYMYLDYDAVAGTVPPIAVASADVTSGNIPLVVNFDASASSDPGGSIASVSWNFGDGTSATGALVQHTYTQAGTFTATATVTDNSGAQNSASVVITAVDPLVVNAPSGVNVAAASRTVTVSWTDNSGNESGFTVERGIKSKTGVITYSVAANTGANATSFTETVAAGTYYYRVRAFNSTTGRTSAYANATSIRIR